MRKDILEKKNEIINMINNNEPKSVICKMLKCKPITLENYLKKMGITYKGNMGLKGKKTDKKRKTALEYLEKDVIVIPKLRKKLIEDKIKKNECEICNLTEWLGQKIPLELHHIDGNRFNNNLNNLQILCSNCHSLVHSNISSSKKLKEIKVKEKNENYCDCGSTIKKRSKLCIECYHNSIRTHIPNSDILMKDVEEIGYSATGRKYGVSDNTIRNWLKTNTSMSKW